MAIGLALYAFACFVFGASSLFNGLTLFNDNNFLFAAKTNKFDGGENARRACSNYTNVIFSHNYLVCFVHVFFQTYATLSRKLLFVKDFLDFF